MKKERREKKKTKEKIDADEVALRRKIAEEEREENKILL